MQGAIKPIIESIRHVASMKHCHGAGECIATLSSKELVQCRFGVRGKKVRFCRGYARQPPAKIPEHLTQRERERTAMETNKGLHRKEVLKAPLDPLPLLPSPRLHLSW